MHFKREVSAVMSLHDGIYHLGNGFLYVPSPFTEVVSVFLTERSELIAEWEVATTSVLVAGVIVLGPSVLFVTTLDAMDLVNEVFVPVSYVLWAVELRCTLEFHLEAAPFAGFYLTGGEVIEGDEDSFDVKAANATGVPVTNGLGSAIHSLGLGGDVLGGGFVFHQPVDAIELDLKVKLTVEDELREFNAKGFLDVNYFHHGAIARIVVVILEEGFCAVVEGTVVVRVECLFCALAVPGFLSFFEGILKGKGWIVPADLFNGAVEAVKESVPGAAVAEGIGAHQWDKVADVAPVELAEARTGTGPAGMVNVEFIVCEFH
jgi:hypothetical protein